MPTPEPDQRVPALAIAALGSIAAGAIHAACAGVHADHATLARLFVAAAAAQLLAGLAALARPSRTAAIGLVAVNAVAVGAWLVTRFVGVSWIGGLEVRESIGFADTLCATAAAIAVGAALAGASIGRRPAARPPLAWYSVGAVALALPAMVVGGTTTHHHDALAADHTHEAAVVAPGEATGHTHDTVAAPSESSPHTHDSAPAAASSGTTASTVHQHSHTPVSAPTAATTPAVAWPRPWDPANPLDLSGVPGVSADQESRARTLVEGTLRDLPRWSTTQAAVADGYRSIGDAATGSEHFIKVSLINDDVLLDPTQPESLVYTVHGEQRTLAGAMFIASARPADDPTLTSFAGPLMTWHTHGNLCWGRVNGSFQVVGLTDANGTCAKGVRAGGSNPMVHVWITPNACGVFAALEGVGQGQSAVAESQRTDVCHHAHDHPAPPTGGTAPAADSSVPAPASNAARVPYDPTKPIDLGGMPGVTPQQQAAAENLVAVTLVRLPKWADSHVAEFAGFRSIGDGVTGYEHYIHWDWINDDVTLDPDRPESLVYQIGPDGTKTLVSAMYMLPDTVTLDQIPDIGGALMQWHIHDNLCFTSDPAPRVAGLTDSAGTCRAGLQKFRPAPMIHVWIVPNACGPFAALEGVGAGQVKPGEEHLCDHVHGSTTTFG